MELRGATAIAIMDKDMTGETIQDIPIVACADTLFANVQHSELDVVFLYLPDENREQIKEMITGFEKMGVTCHYSVDIPGMELPGEKCRQVRRVYGHYICGSSF